jgi:hypothetical protein
LCFIDDEDTELQLGRANLSEYFHIGVGTTITKALSDLGRRKPDLFLLDMYYGPQTSQEQRESIAKARRAFLKPKVHSDPRLRNMVSRRKAASGWRLTAAATMPVCHLPFSRARAHLKML